MEFKPGQQLYVNNKWFFDVLETKDSKVTIRLKYKEAPNREFYLYKNISLPQDLFECDASTSLPIYCKVDPIKLKNIIGSLIDRIIKEKDVYKFANEDAAATVSGTSGMGAVSQSGLSGTPGIPGTAGSGDISLGVGKNKTTLSYDKTTNTDKKRSIKKAMMDILGIDEDLNINIDTENDYKRKINEFLTYPWNKDIELEIIAEINEMIPEFLNAASPRIKDYFKNFWNLNKNLIKTKCTEQFLNQYMILGDITE